MKLPHFRLFFTTLAVGLFFSTGSFLSALSVTVPTFSDLVAKSDEIVRGQVLHVQSRRVTNPAGHELIKTFVTIRPDEMPKGESAPTVVLSFLGGTVKGERFEIPGMPTFRQGDRAWFFIKGNGHSLCPLISGPHGAYREVKDPATGTLRVVRYDGSVMASPEAIVRPPDAAEKIRSASEASVTPATFRAAIYRELGRPAPVLNQVP